LPTARHSRPDTSLPFPAPPDKNLQPPTALPIITVSAAARGDDARLAVAGTATIDERTAMNISLKWLKEYVPTDLGVREVAEALTRVGLNVDNITDLPGGDACLLVEVTSNRPDCLGHLGVARELAAALGVQVRLPEVAYEESPDAAESLTKVEIEDLGLCPLYTARIIKGVKVAPSPAWMAERLEAVGVRPVNNIVDVTNYVMMECGQPLHAFDFARLAENRIVVRRAKAGEHFIAIDHSEHTLARERLVIADARQAVALAGVMGGVDTEISASTADVLLEAAVFDPLNIRTTARTLAMMSESSYRFERRVDPCGTDWASRRACQLMAQVAGGKVASGVAAVGKPLPQTRELALRVARIETLLGLAIPAQTAADILRRLDCEVLEAGAERIRVRIPSWRPDLEREADLIEEVARHNGYEKIPVSTQVRLAYAPRTKAEQVREAVSQALTGAGYFEAVTFTFTSRDHAVRMRPREVSAEPLMCRGTPLALRESLLAGVLESLRVNQSAGEEHARLFEIAKRFVPVEGQELPQETACLALASHDDFEGVRGVVEAVFDALQLAGRVKFVATDRYPDLDPGAAAEIRLDGQPVGMIGRTTPDAAKAFDLDEPPLVAEINYERLIEAADLRPQFRPLPQFPAILRDLALVVDDDAAWEKIEAAVAAVGLKELESVQALSVYRGKQIPEGKKSVALRITLRSPCGTLTHEQADQMQAQVLAALKTSLGAELRA
jgi:phenylalanyl-tRNA synthetase beta chain